MNLHKRFPAAGVRSGEEGGAGVADVHDEVAVLAMPEGGARENRERVRAAGAAVAGGDAVESNARRRNEGDWGPVGVTGEAQSALPAAAREGTGGTRALLCCHSGRAASQSRPGRVRG